MEDHFDATSEPRKEWVTPELKKIDVEEITAAGTNVTDDFGGLS
jgi:hypothetical protein